MKKNENKLYPMYEFIRSYIQNNAYPPSLREISAATGIKSISTVHTYLQQLKSEGLLTTDPAKQRSITLTNKVAPTYGVPLIGSVAAGMPILAYDNIQEYVRLPEDMLRGSQQSDLFLLKVTGSSMIDAGIFDGDMILIDSGINVESGDIAVARVQGDTATVKRVFLEKGNVRLQPENPDMQPIYVDYNDIEVIGKVVGLLRRY